MCIVKKNVVALSGISLTSGTPYAMVASHQVSSGDWYLLLRNMLTGEISSIAGNNTSGTTPNTETTALIGAGRSDLNVGWNGDIYMCGMALEFLPRGAGERWLQDPWRIFQDDQKVFYSLGTAAGGGATTLTAEPGTYTLTGQTVTLKKGNVLAVGHGSYTQTGQDVTLKKNVTLTVGTGTYASTGQDVTLTKTSVAASLNVEHGSYVLSGQNVGLRRGLALVVEHGSYALSGRDVTFKKNVTLTVGHGSYSLTGQDVALKNNHVLAVGHGTYALTGQAAGLSKGSKLVVGTGNYVLTGNDVALRHAFVMLAGHGAYNLTGQDVTLTYTPVGSTVMAVGTGSYLLTGQDIGFIYHRVMQVGTGIYALAGQDVDFVVNAPAADEPNRYYGSGRYNDQLYDEVRSQWEVVELRKRRQKLGLEQAIKERTQPTPTSEAKPAAREVDPVSYVPAPRAEPSLLWNPKAKVAHVVVQPAIEERYQQLVDHRRKVNRKRAAQLIALLS